MNARTGAEVPTLGAAWREFRARRSPQVIAAAITLIAVVRGGLGAPTWHDLAATVAIVAVYPFGEWAIHVHLLHLAPFRWRGRTVELPTARAHRRHHEHPERLDLVLLGPLEAVGLLVAAVPATVALVAGAAALAGVPLGWGAACSATLAGYVLVGVYEWTHFVIHTAHRPRSRRFRGVWRAHRLHHFKNEHFWHGITTTAADRLLGTAPDQSTVARSPTARTLVR